MKRFMAFLLIFLLIFCACAPQAENSPVETSIVSSLPEPEPEAPAMPEVVPVPTSGVAAEYRLAFSDWLWSNLRAMLVGNADVWLVYDETLLHYADGAIATVADDVYGLAGEREGTLYLIAKDTAHQPLFPDRLTFEQAAGLYAMDIETGEMTLLVSGAQRAGLVGEWLVYSRLDRAGEEEGQFRLSLHAYSPETGESRLLFEDAASEPWNDWDMAFGVVMQGNGQYLNAMLSYPKGSDIPRYRALIYDPQLALVADSDEVAVDFGDGRVLYEDITQYGEGYQRDIQFYSDSSFTARAGDREIEVWCTQLDDSYTIDIANADRLRDSLYTITIPVQLGLGPSAYLQNGVLFLDCAGDMLLAYDIGGDTLALYNIPAGAVQQHEQ